ncbi:MAG: hypothetical protein NTW21_11340 [Verrucomicrobia bacterium]|nr:hypothetical protein [Verrucomicrobiota bacterium]
MLRHLCACGLLVCVPLHAAALRILAWDDGTAARKLAIVAGADQVGITGMHPLKRTKPIRLKGSPPFFIRALDKPPGADGKPAQLAFTIPDAITHPLLLLIPDASQPTGLRSMILDDNPAGFHWGCYRFLNATPKEFAVKLEDKTVRVPTGWKPIDLDLGGETRGIAAAAAMTEDLSKPLYSAVWEYDQNVRTLVFMVPGNDPRLSPVLFKAIPEDKTAVVPTPVP